MRNNSAPEEDVIDLLQLARALWRNALVILVAALIFAAAAFGGTFLFLSPTYESTATFYVNNSTVSVGSTSFSISSGELSAASTLVNTYVAILESRTTLEEVIAEGALPYTVTELTDMIDTSTASGTGIFSVTVTSSSPVEAELIANTIAKILPDRIAEIVEGSSVRIVDYGIVPSHRAGPSYVKNTAIGALLGIVLVCGIIVVRELVASGEDEIIRSADDLAALYPDIPVLATIPDMRSEGKKGYYSSYSSYYGDEGRKKEAK